jgi:hypothetical protein
MVILVASTYDSEGRLAPLWFCLPLDIAIPDVHHVGRCRFGALANGWQAIANERTAGAIKGIG